MAKAIDKAAYFKRIGYRPHPKQLLFHNSQARFRVAVCGRRFGKSMMTARDREPQLLLPNLRGWIVGPTYDLAEKEFRVIWDDMIVKLGFGRDKRVKKGYNKKQGDMFIEFPWKTRIECRSADHPENLVGEKLDFAIMSEAAKHKKDTWERFIRPALADNRGTADFPTTPEGQNFLYNLWQLGQNPAYPDYESWQFPSWENPYVYPGGRTDPEIKEQERTTIQPWFLQEIAADFTAFVGKIYSEFQELTHVRPVVFNPLWPNYIAFDWGFVNPLAAVEFQVAPDDTIHVWRLHYKAEWRLAQHLEYLKNREQPKGYRLDLCFGDAADPEAVATVSETFAPCMADPLSKSNWRQGVDLVKRFLTPRDCYSPGGSLVVTDEYGTPKQEPMLFVDNSCVDLIREFNNYRSPQARADLSPREAAQKFDDHALDALRYGLVHIFELGARSHLMDVYKPSDFTQTPEQGYFTTNTKF